MCHISKVETITLDHATMTLMVRNGATYYARSEDFHADTKGETDHLTVASAEHNLLCAGHLIDIGAFDTSFKLYRITTHVLRFVNKTKRQIER